MRIKINDVKKFWNKNPCNIKHSKKSFLSKEYFKEVDKKKFKVEPHIKKFGNFSNIKNKKVLEIGFGIGTMAEFFCKKKAIYTGIELSSKSLNITKKRLSYNSKFKYRLLNLNCEDISKHLKKNEKFDYIFSFGVLHHTANFKKALKEIKKISHSKTEIRIMVYSKNSYKNFLINEGLDRFERVKNVPIANTYTTQEMRQLLSDFKIIEIKKDHIFPYIIKYYKKNIYKKHKWIESMPKKIFSILEKNIGWHMLIKFKLKN